MAAALSGQVYTGGRGVPWSRNRGGRASGDHGGGSLNSSSLLVMLLVLMLDVLMLSSFFVYISRFIYKNQYFISDIHLCIVFVSI